MSSYNERKDVYQIRVESLRRRRSKDDFEAAQNCADGFDGGRPGFSGPKTRFGAPVYGEPLPRTLVVSDGKSPTQ